ncbi:MAG TPA: hypothetical protein VN830_03780 [Verrucomicrobiae bacterium]|nr:hypothetical protein [Verrucomicrobiae bacterium]
MKQPSDKPAKKPYQAPMLLVYGNLIQMTKSHGFSGRTDGAKTGLRRRTGG